MLTDPLTTKFRAPERSLIPLMLECEWVLSEGGEDMVRKKEATTEWQEIPNSADRIFPYCEHLRVWRAGNKLPFMGFCSRTASTNIEKCQTGTWRIARLMVQKSMTICFHNDELFDKGEQPQHDRYHLLRASRSICPESSSTARSLHFLRLLSLIPFIVDLYSDEEASIYPFSRVWCIPQQHLTDERCK